MPSLLPQETMTIETHSAGQRSPGDKWTLWADGKRYISAAWLLIATMLFAFLTWKYLPGRQPSAKKVLLAEQWILLLPPILFLLRGRSGNRSGTARDWFSPPVWAAFALYLCVTIPISARLGDAIGMSDEATYLFQARLLEAGKFYAPAPPKITASPNQTPVKYLPEGDVVSGKRWYGKYPPGWPAFLALWSLLLRAPWLANPVLGFFDLILLRRIAARTFGAAAADASVWIAVASPIFTLNCIGYWSHPLCALLLAGAVAVFLEAQGSNRMFPYALMTALTCAAFFLRPFEAAIFGIILGGFTLWRLRGEKTRAIRFAAIGSCMTLLTVAFMLAYNRATTGNFLQFGYAAMEETKLPEEFSLSPAHLLIHLVHSTPVFLGSTAEAAFPLLFLLAAYGALLTWNRGLAGRLIAVVFGLTVIAHMAGPYTSGSAIGARYYFEAFLLLCVLGGIGWTRFRDRLDTASATTLKLSVVVAVIAVFAYLGNYGIVTRVPYLKMADAVDHLGAGNSVIYLAGTPSKYGPAPAISQEYINLNNFNWQRSRTLSFADPGAPIRSALCSALGRDRWLLLRYDETTGRATVGGEGQCMGSAVQNGLQAESSPGPHRGRL